MHVGATRACVAESEGLPACWERSPRGSGKLREHQRPLKSCDKRALKLSVPHPPEWDPLPPMKLVNYYPCVQLLSTSLGRVEMLGMRNGDVSDFVMHWRPVHGLRHPGDRQAHVAPPGVCSSDRNVSESRQISGIR